MKKKLLYLFVALVSTTFLVSCETEETTFDDAYLIGKWQSGTEYYKYAIDGTGATWDTADDVSEDEAQAFTWTLVQSELTHIYVTETSDGTTKQKVFTVIELTESTLKYRDDLGNIFTFTKVSEIVGKWQSGTLFYKYMVDGYGATWDTADDVNEDEAQAFTWTLVQSELTHIHVMEMGGGVPKVYTVTELTETTLKYRDDFGKSYSFTKVSK